MNFKFEALLKLAPNADFYIEDDVVTWNSSNITQPTEEQIQAKIVEVKAEYEATQYQRDRAAEYPELPEQLDMLFHAIDAGALDKTSAFYTTLKAVKDKYPKG